MLSGVWVCHGGFAAEKDAAMRVDLLAADNVVSADAEAEGRTLRGLGIEPQAADAIAPSYLVRFRKTGQYEAQRSA